MDIRCWFDCKNATKFRGSLTFKGAVESRLHTFVHVRLRSVSFDWSETKSTGQLYSKTIESFNSLTSREEIIFLF